MRQNKKDQGIADVVSNFGFAFEMLKVIAHAVMDKGGNMQHLRRIVKEPTLQRQIADLIVPTGPTEERPRVDGVYRVPVSYNMPRDKEALEAEFSRGGVSETFFGDFQWRTHSSCTEIDQTPGERTMLLMHFNQVIESEDVISQMNAQGYRPATHLEAYAFAKVNPDLQRKHCIIALGSSTRHGDRRVVTVLYGGPDRCLLSDHWVGDGWRYGFRFLAVRK